MYKTLHKKQGSVTVQLRFARSSVTFCAKRDTYTTAIRLQKNGACIYELKNSPPEQVVYYLVNENRKTATIHKFLELLTEKLKTLPKDKITSFLS